MLSDNLSIDLGENRYFEIKTTSSKGWGRIQLHRQREVANCRCISTARSCPIGYSLRRWVKKLRPNREARRSKSSFRHLCPRLIAVAGHPGFNILGI